MNPGGPNREEAPDPSGKAPGAEGAPPVDKQAAHAQPGAPPGLAQEPPVSELEDFHLVHTDSSISGGAEIVLDQSLEANVQIPVRQGGLLFYTTAKGARKVNVYFQGETAWMTQKAMADLFGVQVPAIAKHLKNIFDSEELMEGSVLSILETTAADGKNYPTRFYNLDAIIAVGYRVNSLQATQFRIWATETLREFLTKGFVLDDERMKQGPNAFGRDYFEELLERIREIRASERRFYQKITDIYALSVDYRTDSPTTREFFAAVQNKLHWAITGKTAAETIYDGADATKPHMGLTTWKQAPKGKILKSDVTVAKNYLDAAHIQTMNQLVLAYLELAENRAKRFLPTRMEDWAQFLEDFLALSSYPSLPDKGRVSALEAKLKAEQEYDIYRPIQDANFLSDFDQEVLKKLGKRV